MTTLLATLLANPHDPMRGALSDHWTEYGVPPVVLPCGQVIEPDDPRVVYRDGDAVPWGFRCTMREWCGGECQMRPLYGDNGGWPWHDGPDPKGCPTCGGTGRIPGIAAAVCGAWPIVGVELTDKVPERSAYHWGLWRWYSASDSGSSFDLPHELFELLPDSDATPNGARVTYYDSEKSALAALSHAALTLGRRAAGLPDLPGTGNPLQNAVADSLTA